LLTTAQASAREGDSMAEMPIGRSMTSLHKSSTQDLAQIDEEEPADDEDGTPRAPASESE
jgi:hypothetical protein